MWLTRSGVEAVVFLVFRGRARVGSIWFWTILLLIEEIGTPIKISCTDHEHAALAGVEAG